MTQRTIIAGNAARRGGIGRAAAFTRGTGARSFFHRSLFFGATRVFSACHRLQVGGIAARRIAAQMIEMKARRNWPNDVFVEQPMRTNATRYIARPASRNRTVSLGRLVAGPNPAWRIVTAVGDMIAIPVSFPELAITDRRTTRAPKMRLRRRARADVHVEPAVDCGGEGKGHAALTAGAGSAARRGTISSAAVTQPSVSCST